MLRNKLKEQQVRGTGDYFIFAFGLVFYTSWLYESQALGAWSGPVFQAVKTAFMLGFMALMLVSIRWRELRFDMFLLACLAWLLFNLFSWLEHHDPVAIYLRRVGQLVFFFLFVTYLLQNPEKNPCKDGAERKWFSPWWVFVTLWLLVALNVSGWLAADVESGFGNSRVNFSIWLMQLVALILIFKLANQKLAPSALIGCLVLITPALVLQNMTGGRSGLLGSYLLVCVFAYRWGRWRALLISGIWLYLISLIVANLHPLITPGNNLNVFRNIGFWNVTSFSDFLIWLDQFSSYRVSILVTAFSRLDILGYLYGVGVGNFVGWAPTYPELGIMEVHNVFLKILGKYGVFGFLAATFLTAWPLMSRSGNKRQLEFLYVQGIYLGVAMFQPDLMLTAINLSFVYLASYAYSLSPTAAASREIDSLNRQR